MNKKVAITETFLNSTFKLDSQSKKITISTINQLAGYNNLASLKIHSIDKQKCDSTFRSARVNDDLRVIFSMQGDIITLLYVDHHDKAYDWCNGKYLKKTTFGAEYIFDEKIMLDTNNYVNQSIPDYLNNICELPLLKRANIKEKELIKLDIPKIHVNNLLSIISEDSFIDYVTIFPGELQEALLDLASGTKTFDVVYNELVDLDYEENGNIDSLEQKDSKRRFYITESMEELEVLMENDDYEKWTIFLHPSQEKLVKRDFNGPVLIEGGPGTGKTIVGIHRAAYLSKNIYKASEGKKILFCTFSKKLSRVNSAKLNKLMKQFNIENNVEVVSVDSFIFKTLLAIDGSLSIKLKEFDKLFDDVYKKMKPKGSKSFYHYEYHEIIEKFNIKSLDEYLEVDRSGTGMPLNKNGRILVWRFFETFLSEKKKNKILTFVDLANQLLESIENGDILPEYDSIIIDEAQDLEPVKLKALSKCVKTDRNNIMILSDMNQRIFRLSSWKKDSGINVVGRTFYLYINYRTTKQINDYARYQFTNSEMITTHIKEYKSIMNGEEPAVIGFSNESDQYKYIVNKTKELLQNGLMPHQICIVCLTIEDCKQIKSVLSVSDVKSTLLIKDEFPNENTSVCICPIAGVKGLEFEAVIIYNYNEIGKNRLKEYDVVSTALKINYYKMVECEKYVAATRARDELTITYLEDGEE
ncbi:MAG: UvrD-helicase domain-containing protein [Tissierellia bacterium]|nr:UvrD-helicase domain-containing protein [Tissierellia bacterium]